MHPGIKAPDSICKPQKAAVWTEVFVSAAENICSSKGVQSGLNFLTGMAAASMVLAVHIF